MFVRAGALSLGIKVLIILVIAAVAVSVAWMTVGQRLISGSGALAWSAELGGVPVLIEFSEDGNFIVVGTSRFVSGDMAYVAVYTSAGDELWSTPKYYLMAIKYDLFDGKVFVGTDSNITVYGLRSGEKELFLGNDTFLE